MNRWSKVALMGVLALAGTYAARAEDSGKNRREAWKDERFEMLKKDLNISDDKAAKLKAAFEKGREAGKPLAKALRVSLEKLRWQVDAGADSKEIAATLAEVKKNHKALREAREGVRDSVEAMLTPEQSAKLLLAHVAHFRGPRGRFGPGMGPGGPKACCMKGPHGRGGPGAMHDRGPDGDDDEADEDAPPPPPAPVDDAE
jgi:Spy/CpxP family protein refolding chaperone